MITTKSKKFKGEVRNYQRNDYNDFDFIIAGAFSFSLAAIYQLGFGKLVEKLFQNPFQEHFETLEQNRREGQRGV